MSFKTLTIASLLALASASSFHAVNHAGVDFSYITAGPGVSSAPKRWAAGSTLTLPAGPQQVLKIAHAGSTNFGNSIFQFEYNFDGTGRVVYDMSCNNCLPNGPTNGGPNQDPTINFSRSVTVREPGNGPDGGAKCKNFHIGPHMDFDVKNVYPPNVTQPPESAVGTCNDYGGVIGTFTISK